MKSQNFVSQKIRILHMIDKKGYAEQKSQVSERFVHFYAPNTWSGLLLHKLLNQWHGMEMISPWGVRSNEAQAALIAVFSSSALLGLVSVIFVLTILCGSGQVSLLANQEQWSLNHLLVLLA
ncbi:hypothetical protein ILYODFUR_001972 [Ilyodon furcidens]|uniref:Uncharacterized protein n=1 Tax=Ilyodon furcidens TaxID=33524 RepID=A0ABV0UZG5_9TELE